MAENKPIFSVSSDILILNEDGYGVVTGRIKDIIIRGGENIQPQAIEYFLESHPEIIQAQVRIENPSFIF